jgi:hypothetical protein
VVFVFSLCSDGAVRHVFPIILEGQRLGHGWWRRPGRRSEGRKARRRRSDRCDESLCGRLNECRCCSSADE